MTFVVIAEQQHGNAYAARVVHAPSRTAAIELTRKMSADSWLWFDSNNQPVSTFQKWDITSVRAI